MKSLDSSEDGDIVMLWSWKQSLKTRGKVWGVTGLILSVFLVLESLLNPAWPVSCSVGHQAELDVVVQRMNSSRTEYEQKLAHQAQLLESRAAKITKLEGIFIQMADWSQFKPEDMGLILSANMNRAETYEANGPNQLAGNKAVRWWDGEQRTVLENF